MLSLCTDLNLLYYTLSDTGSENDEAGTFNADECNLNTPQQSSGNSQGSQTTPYDNLDSNRGTKWPEERQKQSGSSESASTVLSFEAMQRWIEDPQRHHENQKILDELNPEQLKKINDEITQRIESNILSCTPKLGQTNRDNHQKKRGPSLQSPKYSTNKTRNRRTPVVNITPARKITTSHRRIGKNNANTIKQLRKRGLQLDIVKRLENTPSCDSNSGKENSDCQSGDLSRISSKR